MKKTTRLTALILALMLLLVSLSASATEGTEGIPLKDLDAETYNALVTAASEDESGTCDGDSCKEIITADALAADEPKTYVDNGNHTFNAMQSMTNAEICDYINELYEGDTTETSIVAFLYHLGTYHTDWATENVCAACSGTYPLKAPGTDHVEECPWYKAVTEVKDTATGITVTGVLPEGTQLKVTDASAEEIPELDVSHLTYGTVAQMGYDISLVDADGNPIADDAFGTVEVYVPGVWDTSCSDPIVDVYHLNDDGTLKELLTSRNGTASICEDGGVIMEVTGFSDYYFLSGQSSGSVTSGTHTLYIAPGMSGTLTLNSTSSVTLNTGSPVTGVTVSSAAGNDQTTFTVTADDSAALKSSGTFTITWREGRSDKAKTQTATFTVMVVSAEEQAKQEFLGNTIGHIQIDIESSAVVLGYNNDASTTVDFGYSQSNTTNKLTKVTDDSAVGFHYELEYTVNGVATKVIIRVDEGQTKLPTGATYKDVADKWDVTGVTNESSQISFNGRIPVGTKDNPIVYSVTVETTLTLTPNGETEAENVEVAISDSIGYWYSTNKCPGLGNNKTNWEAGSVISGSGIDMSEFSTGETIGDTTYYVVFSNLTKVVSGYTFGTGESKNYIFTIYRRLANDANASWEAFDTISITATGANSSTSFTTDATKYEVANIGKYEYKIVETGYSLSGYSCTNEIAIKSGDSYITSTDGKFAFTENKSTDGKTVTYSAEIKCTNTYTEAGLTVTKVAENAPDSAKDDQFTVKVWPKELSSEGIESGTNLCTYFNSGTTYKVGGTALTVTDGSDTTFGYLTITLKGGESKTITGLPAGTYIVQEIKGSDTNWEYDTEEYEVDLSSGNATATVTNKYKFGNLTIVKNVVKSDYANAETFEFTITKPDGSTETKTITVPVDAKTGSVTIEGLAPGTYTVQEKTVDGYTTTYSATVSGATTTDGKVEVTAGATATITVTNTASSTSDTVVTKIWNDSSDKLGVRPEEITVTLKGDDGSTKSAKLTESNADASDANKWTYTFVDVPEYTDAGVKINYTVDEEAVTYYTKSVSGMEITNTINTTSLTITKAAASGTTIGSDENFIFTVKSEKTDYDATVVIKGTGSVTISGLLVGDKITVTEATDWSWRYKATYTGLDENNQITLVTGDNKVTVTNEKDNDQWLTDESAAVNTYENLTSGTTN